ncbi:tetraacyldisaccharide 4'-kinase [uncultured Parabacteroides sp.]|uniref:tetraacyldisaccharide 4'-kinase n=1 Tax=uncultured Parabacteroides sp. TaxID=512312 RepID=UPI0026212D18|nr:tetraacyldisaccharide 4'-kinase [uncultured Parabacteroides sp.]
MLTNHTIKFNKFLAPFSFFYGIGVRFRNLLFDWKVLRTEQYGLPVISVGNLTVGGTGKTPHTEYIIRLIKDRYRVAVLSRGYKRKTSGFLLADQRSTSKDIGDEPYQMKLKFPDILVAVDANRRRGIRNLLALPDNERPEVILLDDAFQHRYVTPTLNILLTDCHRLYTQDKLLPTGRLREPVDGARRADVIIVTKCESCIQPIDFRIIEEDMRLSAYQELYFSHIIYGELEPIFPDKAPKRALKELASSTEVLLVSGIASPKLLEKEIHKYTEHVTSLVFPDHHAFDQHDIQKIQIAFKRLTSPCKLIIITEKDAARLRDLPSLPMEWFPYLYCLPITVGFCMNREKQFQESIFKHIDTRIKNHPISR